MHQIKPTSQLAVNSLKIIARNALLMTAFAVTAASAQTYVGSFKVNDGVEWQTNPQVYSGLEAAALLFGGEPGDYAISVNPNTTDPSTITHTAYYSVVYVGCSIFPEGESLDAAPTGYASPTGDRSAYVRDNCTQAETNYVWRLAAPAPTPTPVPTLGGVGLLLLSGLVAGSMGLMRRRKSI